MPKDKNYDITVPIEEARGFQYFSVRASSEKEALAKWKSGSDDVEFVDQEVEILHVGNPEIAESEDQNGT